MKNTKLANLANQSENEAKVTDLKLTKALDTVIKEVNIQQGSLKIYVHQGKWSPRIEIQNHVVKKIGSN